METYKSGKTGGQNLATHIENDLYPQFTYEKGFHSPEDTKSIRDLFWPPGPKNQLFEMCIFQKYENYGYFRFR